MAALGVYVVTFNCGRALANSDAFAKGLFSPYVKQNANLPDLVVLSLQEIAPMSYSFLHSFLGFDWLSPYFDRIIVAVNRAAGSREQYLTLATHNVGMTAILVLAKADFAAQARLIETAAVGAGVLEMGNKGAVGVRLHHEVGQQSGLSQLTFVAAHLAPMEDAVERRNADWKNIVRGLVFKPRGRQRTPISAADGTSEESRHLLERHESDSDDHGMFSGKSPLVFAGDLNYRSSNVAPTQHDYKDFPQPVDNIDDQLHYSHLFGHDQLRREMKAGRTAHLLAEVPVEFPPTYKYSLEAQKLSHESISASTGRWHWAQHRFPSWCDRVLISDVLVNSTDAFRPLGYDALPIQPTSDHRPVALAFVLNTNSTSLMERLDKVTSPFTIDMNAEQRRANARRLEILVGLVLFLGTTREGNGLLLATTAGAIGVWFVAAAFIAR